MGRIVVGRLSNGGVSVITGKGKTRKRLVVDGTGTYNIQQILEFLGHKNVSSFELMKVR